MRSKRNNADLCLCYCLQMFLQVSFNEAKAESTTVKSLAVQIFAKHYVRKKEFVIDPTLQTHHIKLWHWDWIAHSPFLMQKLYKSGLEIKVVDRNNLVFGAFLPISTDEMINLQYSLRLLERNSWADPSELTRSSCFKPYLPFLPLIFFQLSVLLQAVKALCSLCRQPLSHKLV